MHGERRLRHPTAPRGASMLEKKKHGNWKRNGAGANCSDVIASGQDFRTARVAIAAQKIRHRDIVNLKQSVTRHAALQEAPFGADVTTRSEAGRVHDPLPRSRLPRSNRLIVSAQDPAQTLSQAAARTRPEFATPLYVGASGCIGKFFSRL
jgi:hypothetical protein